MSNPTWNRIEPSNDAGSIDRGLAAPLADPLWLLGRQWQVGELQGDDAATPIAATVETEVFAIDRLRVGTSERAFDPRLALEAYVEPEPYAPADLRLRLTAGRDLRASLITAHQPTAAAALRTIAAPSASSDRLEAALILAAGAQAIDGERVAAAIKAHGSQAVAASLDAAAATAVRAILDTWYAAFRPRTDPDAPTAWSSDDMAYRFSVVAPFGDKDLVLDAPRYRGGTLDWCDFTASLQPRAQATAPKTQPSTMLPAPLDFAGGPARRYFELERAGTSFALVAGAPPDIATALLVEAALIFDGRWFVIPVKLPVGTLARIKSITVIDSFGSPAVLGERIRSDGWRMFECSGDPAAQDLLAIIPTVTEPLEGPAIESVALVRDEAANTVWAIEDVVADALGAPRAIEHPRPSVPPDTMYSYIPFIGPPASWFPLVRRDKPDRFVGASPHGVPAADPPQGQILANWPHVALHTTDVPPEGLRIERRYQLAVSRGGAGAVARRALWITRTDRIARAPGSSGVAADQLVPPGNPP